MYFLFKVVAAMTKRLTLILDDKWRENGAQPTACPDLSLFKSFSMNLSPMAIRHIGPPIAI